MIGLEVAASVLYQVLIRDGGSDWSRFAMASSISPAKIGGLDGFGEIAVGKPANLMLFDPASSKTISAPTNSLSSNNPWMGHKLVGEVIHTLYRGRFTFSNGAVNG